MRTSPEDGSQRMLNAMLPGTEVAVHCHPNSNENVILITGKIYEILYEETENGELMETERIFLCPAEGRFGCQVPKGVWHTVEVIEPSVIYEAKDGKYGEDIPHSLSFRLSAAHGALGSAACHFGTLTLVISTNVEKSHKQTIGGCNH